MKNKKKILAAAGILVLAGVAAVCYIKNIDKKEAASIRIISGSVLLTKKQKRLFWTLKPRKSSPMGMSWNLTM